jgi:hypothetical protein
MGKRMAVPGITIFAGRFGSGKTETAVNYALALAGASGCQVSGLTSVAGQPAGASSGAAEVALIDLDIVTPYFRSRETADVLKERGVKVIAPAIIGQHLDTPAITPEILGTIQRPHELAVLDVGGDRQGARALGQFSAAIRERGYTMHFVVNPYRPFTDSVDGLASSIAEIEQSARLRVTSLVSNPNLIVETTPDKIVAGHRQVEALAREIGLPIAFVCVERRWLDALSDDHFAQPVLVLERHFVMSWE